MGEPKLASVALRASRESSPSCKHHATHGSKVSMQYLGAHRKAKTLQDNFYGLIASLLRKAFYNETKTITNHKSQSTKNKSFYM